MFDFGFSSSRQVVRQQGFVWVLYFASIPYSRVDGLTVKVDTLTPIFWSLDVVILVCYDFYQILSDGRCEFVEKPSCLDVFFRM